MNSVHVSIMTGKLQGLRAISTNTVSNPFCIKMYNSKNKKIICTKCYSHDMLNTYRKNMQDCLQKNSNLLSNHYIDNQIPVLNDLYFRYNAHGELINELHLHNLVQICLKNPKTNFALWSKRKDLVKKYFSKNDKPSNLILVYSNPVMNKPIDIRDIPLYFDKTFNNVDHDKFTKEQNCTGQKCIDCLKCYNHNNDNTIIEAVKKNGRVIK